MADVTRGQLYEFYAYRARLLEWVAVEQPDDLDWFVEIFAVVPDFNKPPNAHLLGRYHCGDVSERSLPWLRRRGARRAPRPGITASLTDRPQHGPPDSGSTPAPIFDFDGVRQAA
jgi:hypothetical protein